MKIYQYWEQAEDIADINGITEKILCFGGSNNSPDDARAKAFEKIHRIKNKINGSRHEFDNYEVEIREEIIQKINNNSIITRNRYGALVLNTQELTILDLDEPKKGFWEKLGFGKTSDKKTKIIEQASSIWENKYKNYGFRFYETANGIRLIVTGKYFPPKNKEFSDLAKDTNCDSTYTLLCVKQDCCRARLTPKPYRIKSGSIKVIFPADKAFKANLDKWIAQYDEKSQGFSVCKYIKTLGHDPYPSETIKIHDRICRAGENLKLA